MAAALPQKIALLRCTGCSVRAAMAMTTALSPDKTILASKMEPKALQKTGEEKSRPKSMVDSLVMN
jgi:hypothetical protein